MSQPIVAMEDTQAKINDKQRVTIATFSMLLLIAALFFIPWRIESNGKLAWAPFYRNPVVGRSTMMGESIDTQYIRLKGRPVWVIYGLQLLIIGGTGAAVYEFVREEDEEE